MFTRIRLGALLLLVSFSYANMRLAMNREFEDARWQQLLDMTAPRPYVGRLLIPRILHLWQICTSVTFPTMFLTIETLAALGLILGVAATLQQFIGFRAGVLAALVLILSMAIPFMLQHRWPIYYPYDTPSMAFIAWGLWAAVRRRPVTLSILTFMAALNRESAVLLPLIAVAVWLPESTWIWALRRTLPAFLSLGVSRLLVWTWTRGLKGPTVSLFVGGRPRFVNNADWFNSGAPPPGSVLNMPSTFHSLLNPFQVFLFVLGLPLAYLVFQRYIPIGLRLIRIPLAISFFGLMFVGNVYEPRIFAEIIVALFIPVTVGALAWARGDEESDRARAEAPAGTTSRVVVLLDRLPWGCTAFFGWWILGTLCLHLPSLAALFSDQQGGR